MTRITNSEQALLILRAQLQKLGREKKLRRPGKPTNQAEADIAPLDRMQVLAELEGLSDEDHQRIFVRTILAEEFGAGLANEPKFISISDDVYKAISSDGTGRDLLQRALEQMILPGTLPD